LISVLRSINEKNYDQIVEIMSEDRLNRVTIKTHPVPQISKSILEKLMKTKPKLRAYNWKPSKKKISYLDLLPKRERKKLSMQKTLEIFHKQLREFKGHQYLFEKEDSDDS